MIRFVGRQVIGLLRTSIISFTTDILFCLAAGHFVHQNTAFFSTDAFDRVFFHPFDRSMTAARRRRPSRRPWRTENGTDMRFSLTEDSQGHKVFIANSRSRHPDSNGSVLLQGWSGGRRRCMGVSIAVSFVARSCWYLCLRGNHVTECMFTTATNQQYLVIMKVKRAKLTLRLCFGLGLR